MKISFEDDEVIQPPQPSPDPKKAEKPPVPAPPKEGTSEFDHVMEKIALDVAKDFWHEHEKK